MKLLILALLTAHIALSPAAFAWEPLGGAREVVEESWRCLRSAASAEEGKETDSAAEEDEEPDCE